MPFFSSLTILKVLLFIGGVGWALINVQAYPLVADFGGLTKIGFFTGMYYLFSMASSIFAPGLLGLSMDIFGHPALFYTAAFTFFVAFIFLKLGMTIMERYLVEATEKR